MLRGQGQQALAHGFQLLGVKQRAHFLGSAWASTPRPASGDAARTWRARVRACERPIRVRNKYITASTMPHATLQPNAAASKVDASNGPALAIDSEPMIVTAMMRPNSTSEIRSTGLSSC